MFTIRGSRKGTSHTAAEPFDVGAKVLAFLFDQQLAPTPANYALGYAYFNDGGSRTARAIDLILIGGERIDQMRADRIIADYVRPVGTESVDQQCALRHRTLQLSEIAAGATAVTGKLNRDLDTGLTALTDGASLVATVRSMLDRSRESEAALVAASHEIEQLRKEVEAAKDDAARGALTGLPNRRGVEAEVGAMPASTSSMLAICDIDHFKSINDRYGHLVGDRVLKVVASSLAESCRPHVVARWGGEEFVVLINGLNKSQAAELVDKARMDLQRRDVRLRTTNEPLGAITFSAGVAIMDGDCLDDAVRQADACLYRAKAAGRDRVLA